MFWADVLRAKVLGAAQNRCRCILGSQKLRLSAKLTAAASLHHSAELTSCCQTYTALRGSYRATRPSVWPGPFYVLSPSERYSWRRSKVVSRSLDVANCKISCSRKDWNVFCTRFHVKARHVHSCYLHNAFRCHLRSVSCSFDLLYLIYRGTVIHFWSIVFTKQ